MLGIVGPAVARAGPRDAAAVLNRCGRPLEGDEIILEDTVTGGRRILSYERGVLHFDKEGADGWSFSYGSHRKQAHLDAAEMGAVMPCFGLALADSLAALPLPHETPAKRVEASMRENIKEVVIWSIGLLAACGLILVMLPRRRAEAASEE